MAEVPADVLARYSRSPDEVTAAGAADEFLSLACLRYAGDEPARWARAREILREHPEIIGGDAPVAAAIAHPEAPRPALARDPAPAPRRRGPVRGTAPFYPPHPRPQPHPPPAG